jgi:N-sulfoglucosamine sulfohydrolase
MDRLNIVYIHTHDSGRYIQPYGHPVPTPNLQSLADEGVVFRNAFCVSPSCSPSRACFLTGQYTHNNGMMGLSHTAPDLVDIGIFRLKNPEHHMVHTLKQAGYTTVLTGVEHIVELSDEAQRGIGYDQFIGSRSNGEKSAAEFLDSGPTEPFFLTVGFNETHRGFPEPGPAEDPKFCSPPVGLPDTPETRRDMAGYKTSARIVDGKIGEVFAALKRNGLWDNTLIIATTDHGIPFPRMKGNLTDGGTGVFLILRGPGGFHGGRVSDGLVSQIDVFPTICDLLSIDAPEWLDGKSLVPMVAGEQAETHDAIFTELTYHRVYEPLRAIRTSRWKYIRRFAGKYTANANADPKSISTDYWTDCGWNDAEPEEEMLYDLVFDPTETHNLIGHPKTRQVCEDLRNRLERWMHETADPLLAGPIPGPRGDFEHDRDYLRRTQGAPAQGD